MNSITFTPDKDLLLQLFYKNTKTYGKCDIYLEARSIGRILIEHKITQKRFAFLNRSTRENVSIYSYCMMFNDTKNLWEKLTGKKSKDSIIYDEYNSRLDKTIFNFKKDVIRLDIIEYYDVDTNNVIYSFLNDNDIIDVYKIINPEPVSTIMDQETIKKILKKEIASDNTVIEKEILYHNPNVTNYFQVVPNSHMFSKLEQINMAFDRKEDIEFIRVGIQNSIKNGFDIQKTS